MLLLIFGAVVLAGAVLYAAGGVWEFTHSATQSAWVVKVDNGHCTYNWEGQHQAGVGDSSCPGLEQVGDPVEIVVADSGIAYPSYTFMAVEYIAMSLFQLVVGGVLVFAGLRWRARRRPPELQTPSLPYPGSSAALS